MIFNSKYRSPVLMDPNLFQRRITLEQAEAEHIVSDERLGEHPVIFGFLNRQWLALISKMKTGDELWEYSSTTESWDNLMGSEGIVLIRNDEIIDSIVTRMN